MSVKSMMSKLTKDCPTKKWKISGSVAHPARTVGLGAYTHYIYIGGILPIWHISNITILADIYWRANASVKLL